jgi:hypothetical protein
VKENKFFFGGIFMKQSSVIVPFNPAEGQKPAVVLLYLGPDSILPLASILAAVAGFFLIFWRYIQKSIKKFVRWILRKPAETPPAEMPEPAPITSESESKDQI